MARSRRDLFVEDEIEYDAEGSAEIDAEDLGFQLDDPPQDDQGDSGTPDPPIEPEEVG